MSDGGHLAPDQDIISKIKRTASLALIMEKYHVNPGVNWTKMELLQLPPLDINAIVLQLLCTALRPPAHPLTSNFSIWSKLFEKTSYSLS